MRVKANDEYINVYIYQKDCDEQDVLEQTLIKAAFLIRDLDSFDKHELHKYLIKAGLDITNYNIEKIISILCKCGYLKINEEKVAKYGYVYDVVKIFSER